jgi:serine/threonine protein phosphatase PrpC
MEDAYSVENGGRFVAVFDGHGGSEVSSALRDRLYELYCKVLSTKHWEQRDDFDLSKKRIPSISSHVAALRGALEQVEEEILKHDDLVYQGSTAVAVVLHVGEDGRKTVLSANVGDSRAVLSRKGNAIELTRDHKPNDAREKARIRAQGAEVQWDPYGQVYRVRDLSLSRAIGDRFAKPAVSSEAEIKHFPVAEEDDEFILLASDGLWDVMTSQEVVDFVHESLKNSSGNHAKTTDETNADTPFERKQMARTVANEAIERGSADNVCVVVVWLKDHAPQS